MIINNLGECSVVTTLSFSSILRNTRFNIFNTVLIVLALIMTFLVSSLSKHVINYVLYEVHDGNFSYNRHMSEKHVP